MIMRIAYMLRYLILGMNYIHFSRSRLHAFSFRFTYFRHGLAQASAAE
jgi:hypothetical protein